MREGLSLLSIDIARIKGKYCKKIYSNKFNKFRWHAQISLKADLLKLTNDETENLNSSKFVEIIKF